MESTKTILVNMLVTFVQAGGAVWAAAGFATDRVVIGAVVGAGLSAVWNLALKPLLASRGYLIIKK